MNKQNKPGKTSQEDRDLLVVIINKYKKVIENKSTDVVCNAEKKMLEDHRKGI